MMTVAIFSLIPINGNAENHHFWSTNGNKAVSVSNRIPRTTNNGTEEQSTNQTNTKSLRGVVRDETGEPLTGVSIYVKDNKRNAAVTDMDGRYEINVPENATLIYSFIGFITQETRVGGSSVLDVKMKEDKMQSLNEVVVVGYGTMKKSDLTGTTAQIKSTTLTSVVTGNALESDRKSVV